MSEVSARAKKEKMVKKEKNPASKNGKNAKKI